MLCDYYVVRKGYLEIKNLYSVRPTGPYFYTYGIHLRAYGAYIAGIVINVVGFAGDVGRKVPKGATYIFRLNFFCGFIVSFFVYWILCKIWPIPATSDRWLEVGGEFEDPSLAYVDSDRDEEATNPVDVKRPQGGKFSKEVDAGAFQD